MRMPALACAAALVFAGCATTRTAHLYDIAAPSVLTASYSGDGSGRGAMVVGNPKRPACRGEYTTVSDRDAAWGAIFTAAVAEEGVEASSTSERRGSVVLTCDDGRVIRCEYVTGAHSGDGHGSCQDNHAREYRVTF